MRVSDWDSVASRMLNGDRGMTAERKRMVVHGSQWRLLEEKSQFLAYMTDSPIVALQTAVKMDLAHGWEREWGACSKYLGIGTVWLTKE